MAVHRKQLMSSMTTNMTPSAMARYRSHNGRTLPSEQDIARTETVRKTLITNLAVSSKKLTSITQFAVVCTTECCRWFKVNGLKIMLTIGYWTNRSFQFPRKSSGSST